MGALTFVISTFLIMTKSGFFRFQSDNSSEGDRRLSGAYRSREKQYCSLDRPFLRIQGGELLIDGRDIRRLDLAQFRQHLGIVPQEPFLFSGTVKRIFAMDIRRRLMMRSVRQPCTSAAATGWQIYPMDWRLMSVSAAQIFQWDSGNWSLWRGSY
jgi:hypothetical protein